jgi:threonyl-tRNA synthetase
MFEISTKRHSLTHILAQAVKDIYPEVKLGTGPDTETGFYYDFYFGEETISDKELKNIEKKMKNIIKQNQKFNKYNLGIEEAKKFLSEIGEDFKIELVDKLANKGETEVSFYENIDQKGERKFVDLCAGPHVEKTLDIDVNAFKLDKLSATYWQADANNPSMIRIYGLAFDTREELDAHLKFIAEAKKRDHRVLGEKLKLFTISPLIGSGLPLMQPNGMIVRKALEDWLWDMHEVKGYSRVWTPHIAKECLYETS